jgi:hypothetical protein
MPGAIGAKQGVVLVKVSSGEEIGVKSNVEERVDGDGAASAVFGDAACGKADFVSEAAVRG